MMKRLWILVFGLTGVLGIGLFAGRSIGQRQPLSPLPPEVAVCGGDEFCILNVIPGQTAWSRVLDQAHYGTSARVLPQQIMMQPRPKVTLSFLSSTYWGGALDQATAPLIELSFVGDARLFLLDWIARFGSPCRVELNPSLNLLNLEYPSVRVGLTSDQSMRTPDAH